nr:5'/3'-nucleotidase SurE [uncultured Holophaga sp.]
MSPRRPFILLTNDDGIDSPGLHAAAEALAPLGELWVAAPTHQQTAMGRSHTGRTGARLEPVELPVATPPARSWRLEASPASVVRHTLLTLCRERQPDLVVSGINYGENVGTTITASGTVGAAIEAAAYGIPALAISLQMDFAGIHQHGKADWEAAAHFTRYFAQRLLDGELPSGVDVLKVDVPDNASPRTPWRLTRLSRQPYVHVQMEPGAGLREGRLTVGVDEATLEPDSDIHALVKERLVAVTPLTLDATSRSGFGELQSLLEG